MSVLQSSSGNICASKATLYFCEFMFNSKVICSNGLGREVVYLLFFFSFIFFLPDRYLWFVFFSLNPAPSPVVLLSDILTIQKLLLLFRDCDTDSCDM